MLPMTAEGNWKMWPCETPSLKCKKTQHTSAQDGHKTCPKQRWNLAQDNDHKSLQYTETSRTNNSTFQKWRRCKILQENNWKCRAATRNSPNQKSRKAILQTCYNTWTLKSMYHPCILIGQSQKKIIRHGTVHPWHLNMYIPKVSFL